VAWLSVNDKPSTQKLSASPHADQAKTAIGTRKAGGLKSPTIIMNVQLHLPQSVCQLNVNFARPRMFERICDGFFCNAQKFEPYIR
jgi:hypothetical protein